jgi:hypothetical protein
MIKLIPTANIPIIYNKLFKEILLLVQMKRKVVGLC